MSERKDEMLYIDYRPKENYFALRVHGQAMSANGIMDGSVVVCRKQATAESGDIVVCLLNGKHKVAQYNEGNGHVFLSYGDLGTLPDFIADANELLILGKVVEVRHYFQEAAA